MRKLLRPTRIEGDTAYVTLTRGYEAVIDAADAAKVDGVNWNATSGRNVYAVRSYQEDGRKIMVMMHRVILADEKTPQVDHIDGDGLNNRRANLRAATQKQNGRNKARPKNNTLGHKGLCRVNDKWCARVTKDGYQHWLGCFHTKEEAIEAYRKAAQRLHGKFARIE